MNRIQSNKSRWLLFGGKALLSTCLLVWLISRVDLTEIFAVMLDADSRWLLVALLQPILGVWITAQRWRGLLSAHGVSIPTLSLGQTCLVAGFASQFLPSTIGGDAVRGYDTWRMGASKSVAIVSLAADRLLGFLVLVLFAVLTLTFARELTRDFPFLYATALVAAVVLLLLTCVLFVPAPRIRARGMQFLNSFFPTVVASPMARLMEVATAYWGKPRHLLRALFLSVLHQANVVTYFFVLSQALGFSIEYAAFFVIVPVAIFVMLAPISINGIGIRENIFVLLLAMYQISPSHAVAFAWLDFGIKLIYAIVGGIIYALRNDPKKIAIGLPES